MHAFLVALALALLPLPRQEPQLEALEARAREVAAIVSAEPSWPADLFDPAFLAQVPPDRMRAIGTGLHEACGALVELQRTQRTGPFAAQYDLILAKDQVVPMTLTLGETPPHSVIGLWFGAPAPMLADLDAAAEELAKLPGRISLAVWKLGGEEPEVLAAHAPDEALGVGSAFKLYVLGALVDELRAKRLTLDRGVPLEARHRSLPSGQMQDWPLGMPVNVGTLAALMISISDNTATDHLLGLLGRERVEAQLEAMGNRHAARNRPFLATHELFRLKLTRGGSLAEAYLALPQDERAAYLAGEVAAVPLDEQTLERGAFARPNRIESLEWFASAADLCRAMDWLRRSTEGGGEARTLREVLAIRRGVDVSRELFPWCGFKGGSEPGVLALSFLLRHRGGEWLAFSVVWNDPAAHLEEARLLGLAQRALYVLGTSR